MANSRVQDFIFQGSATILFILLISASCSYGFFGEWGPDLEGPWCATRPRGEDCCVGRDDVCAVPILGTECYCDIFCNETAYDCCPDYWQHCHGFRIPVTTPRPTTLPTPRTTRAIRRCYRDGWQYMPGETTQNNCNKCTCQRVSVDLYDWQCTNNICLIRPEMIMMVNDGPYTWKARNYSKFWGMTLNEGITYRLGTFLLEVNVLQMTPIRVLEDDALPESFDARQKWPNLIYPVKDQGNCGSSWAHSTTAVASDRIAIESNGAIKVELSVQHLLSCNVNGQQGCEGGNLDRAWWFLRKKGVVTEKCYPYTSGKTDDAGACLWPINQQKGTCPTGVEYKSGILYHATPPYRIRPQEREIMKEIMDNGPVQATFLVREDFFLYAGGIYKYTALTTRLGESEDYVKSGFHSVRIVGWGAERTFEGDIIKYWLCSNSWGQDWGENGYFRILRGADESHIERYVVGVWGKISGDDRLHALLTANRRRERRLRNRRNRRHLRNLRTRRQRRRSRNRNRRNRRHHQRNNKHKKSNKKTKKSRGRREKSKSLKTLRRMHNKSNTNSNYRISDLEHFFPGLNH